MSDRFKPSAAGKGDKARPVNGKVYRDNHDAIKWPSKNKDKKNEKSR